MFGGSVRRPQLDPVVVVAMANRKQGGAADGQVRAELRVQTPRSWDVVVWSPAGAGGT